MERILVSQTANYIGQKAKVAGWVNARRDHGKIAFLDLRDRSGILQVFVSNTELLKDIQDETIVEIEGTVQARPEKMINLEIETGKVELSAESIKILSKAETPVGDILKISSSSA